VRVCVCVFSIRHAGVLTASHAHPTTRLAARPQVSSKLWRKVVEVVHKLQRLQKAQALAELAAHHAGALEELAGADWDVGMSRRAESIPDALFS
jgi:hypothetical protein